MEPRIHRNGSFSNAVITLVKHPVLSLICHLLRSQTVDLEKTGGGCWGGSNSHFCLSMLQTAQPIPRLKGSCPDPSLQPVYRHRHTEGAPGGERGLFLYVLLISNRATLALLKVAHWLPCHCSRSHPPAGGPSLFHVVKMRILSALWSTRRWQANLNQNTNNCVSVLTGNKIIHHSWNEQLHNVLI